MSHSKALEQSTHGPDSVGLGCDEQKLFKLTRFRLEGWFEVGQEVGEFQNDVKHADETG